MTKARVILNATIPLDYSLGEPCLACPVCGDNYVHPTAITCSPPGAIGRGMLKVDAQGIHLDPTIEPVVRGVSITLEFLCEQGHTFGYRLEFHKGQTYVYPHKDEQSDPDGNWSAATIWRN